MSDLDFHSVPHVVNERMWTTRDGTRMRMADMTVSHLFNASSVLVRASLEAFQQDDYDRHQRLCDSMHLVILELQSRNLHYDEASYALMQKNNHELWQRHVSHENNDYFGIHPITADDI